MYYYIKGEFIKNGDGFIVVEANGIGYKINTSLSAMRQMPCAGERVLFFTYLHVREDVQDLYGFPTENELEMFLKLLSVSGVGPKAALAILSAAQPSEIALAVIQKNTSVIMRAQGVGPKLAERVILELKNKIKNSELIPADYTAEPISDSSDEAVEALTALGYSEQEAKRAVGLAEDAKSVEETVKQALKNLMK